MSLSRKARRRLKFVAPLERAGEVVCVVFPLISMCPPGGNNSAAFAAHDIDHHGFDVFHEPDSQHALFAMSALALLKHRPLENLDGIGKINKMLCEIQLALGFVPLEKHSRGSHGNRSSICTYCTYTQIDFQGQTRSRGSRNPLQHASTFSSSRLRNS